MRQKNITKGTVGWNSLYNEILSRGELSEDDKETIRYRVKVIDHFRAFGLASTLDAFDESRATIYRWNKVLNDTKGNIYKLAKTSTKPKTFRKGKIPLSVYDFVQRHKELQPKLGKLKISALIERELGLIISPNTVQRIIDELKRRGILKPLKRLSLHAKTGKLHYLKQRNIFKTRRNGYTPTKPGDHIQIDTVVFFHNGARYYLLTAIDIFSREAYASISQSASSLSAKLFLEYILTQQTIIHIQTDNGSEFHKYFDEACTELQITHFWNTPRNPKQNAFIERFNRTIQEEFLKYHRHLLYESHLTKLKSALSGYLSWYNTYRPHHSLGLLTPRAYTDKYYQEAGVVSNV